MSRIPELIKQKAFKILSKKDISFLQHVSYEQPNYQLVLNLWKEYRFLGVRNNSFFQNNSLIEDIFKFHLQSPINHGVMYYSRNCTEAIIFFKIDHHFFVCQ